MPKPELTESDWEALDEARREEVLAEEEALDKRGDDEVALQRELARNPLNRYPAV